MTSTTDIAQLPEWRTETSEGDVKHTLQLMLRAIRESATAVAPIAKRLAVQANGSQLAAAKLVYDYVQSHVKYVNDKPGVEQIHTAQRTLAQGFGDCDDMTIVAAAILNVMRGIDSRLDTDITINIIQQNNSGTYTHVFCSYGTQARTDNNLIKGYSIDPVPPLTFFNQIAPGITKNWRTTVSPMKHEYLNGIADSMSVTEQAKAQRALLVDAYAQNPTAEIAREIRKLTGIILMDGDTEAQALAFSMLDGIHDMAANSGVWVAKPTHAQSLNALCDTLGKIRIGKPKQNADGTKQTVKQQITRFASNTVLAPAATAGREAVKLLIHVNVFGLAKKLSYLFRNDTAAALANRKAKVFTAWQNFGGKPENLEKAVRKWMDKKGISGLGEPVTTAAAIAAAAPVVAALMAALFGGGGKAEMAAALKAANVNDPDALADITFSATEAMKALNQENLQPADFGFKDNAQMQTAITAMTRGTQDDASGKPTTTESESGTQKYLPWLLGGGALIFLLTRK